MTGREVDVELAKLSTDEQLHVLWELAREHPDLVAAKVRAENGVWHGKLE